MVWMLATADIIEAFNRWKFREPLPEDAHKKVCNLYLVLGYRMLPWSGMGFNP